MRGNLYTFSLSVVLFSVMMLYFCSSVGRAYSDAASKNHVNAWNRQRFQEFYTIERDTLDMIFIGSSHSYCTFDPLLIDAQLGVNSYQLGMPQQTADGTYYTLREILNYQSPSVVVMEVYWMLLNKEFDLKQAEMLFQVIDNDELKAEYIARGFPINERVKYYLPFIRFQQDFFMYKNKELLDYFEEEHGFVNWDERWGDPQEGVENYSDKGFMYCDYTIPKSQLGSANQFNGFDGKNWVFDKNQRKYLDKIVQLCKQEGIELIFVTAPVANVSMEIIKNYNTVHEVISNYAEENGIPYLDFNRMVDELFTNEHFRDDAHLNYSGAVIACEYFSEFMQ